MMCPECGNDKTTVTKTAGTTKEYAVDRYRKCLKCNNGFKTVERVITDEHHSDIKAIVFDAVTVAIKELIQNQSTTPPAPQQLISCQMTTQ